MISDEPLRARKARVCAENDEWAAAVEAGLSRNVPTLIDPADVARNVFGTPILNGAFSFQKTVFNAEGDPMQRFIANLVFNGFISWDRVGHPFRDPKLPYPSQLCLFSIRKGHCLLTWSDDKGGRFNLYSLPSSWHPYLAFEKPYGHQLVALNILPMRPVLCVGIIQ